MISRNMQTLHMYYMTWHEICRHDVEEMFLQTVLILICPLNPHSNLMYAPPPSANVLLLSELGSAFTWTYSAKGHTQKRLNHTLSNMNCRYETDTPIGLLSPLILLLFFCSQCIFRSSKCVLSECFITSHRGVVTSAAAHSHTHTHTHHSPITLSVTPHVTPSLCFYLRTSHSWELLQKPFLHSFSMFPFPLYSPHLFVFIILFDYPTITMHRIRSDHCQSHCPTLVRHQITSYPILLYTWSPFRRHFTVLKTTACSQSTKCSSTRPSVKCSALPS